MIAAYKWKYHSSSIIEGIFYQKKKKKRISADMGDNTIYIQKITFSLESFGCQLRGKLTKQFFVA